jgi:hypothetical protein
MLAKTWMAGTSPAMTRCLIAGSSTTRHLSTIASQQKAVIAALDAASHRLANK